jgi:hypothetical protein
MRYTSHCHVQVQGVAKLPPRGCVRRHSLICLYYCLVVSVKLIHAVRYARQLEKKGRMKLVYVMMQEECVCIASFTLFCILN